MTTHLTKPDAAPAVLDYRSPQPHTASRFGPRYWMNIGLALGVLAWGSCVLMCGGAAWPLAWLPVSIAAVGLVVATSAATRPLPRDATPLVLLAVCLNFSLLALWLLGIVLL